MVVEVDPHVHVILRRRREACCHPLSSQWQLPWRSLGTQGLRWLEKGTIDLHGNVLNRPARKIVQMLYIGGWLFPAFRLGR